MPVALAIITSMRDKLQQCRDTVTNLCTKYVPARLRDRVREYLLLTRVDRPIGIFLLLWPTLWSLWIAAEGVPEGLVLFVFVTGVFLMRSAGCVINDFADRKLDPHVARTKNRPIAAGRVTPREALSLFVVLCLLAFLLVLLMNSLTIVLSFVGVVLAAIYPFMKRHTYLPQVFLGLAFGWAVPMAWAAQTGETTRIAWLLLTATVVWATAYDTMYAMVDRSDDLKIGVKSTAILFGDADRLIIGGLQLSVLLILLLVGYQLGLGLYYYLGLLVAAGLGVYQQYLIRKREPQNCFRAFLNNNWFGMAIFAGLVLNYL
jgi:4-hydroxybenzoate polyprenyltransferase